MFLHQTTIPYIFGGIPSLLIIENLQSSHISSGLSVSFTPQILQIILYISLKGGFSPSLVVYNAIAQTDACNELQLQ